jgi:ketosteroid isomerase-like protein
VSQLKEFFHATHTNLGTVFYPTHFVFAAFPSLDLAQQASRALMQNGFPEEEMQVASSAETEEFFQEFRSERGVWGKFMRGLSREILSTQAKFCDLDMARAREGASFVAVRCVTEEEAHRITEAVAGFSPIGMQWYRSIVIENLASSERRLEREHVEVSNHPQSLNAIFFRFVRAVSEVDCETLRQVSTDDVQIDVPGARFVDITRSSHGPEALCDWAMTVRRECGPTTFHLHRYFENGCELMANGTIEIQHLPGRFESPCSFHVRFESGKIAAFQLLLDTYALQKFRGKLD